MPIPTLTVVPALAGAAGADAVIVVGLAAAISDAYKEVSDAALIDATILNTNVASCVVADVPGRRLITAPTGPLNRVRAREASLLIKRLTEKLLLGQKALRPCAAHAALHSR